MLACLRQSITMLRVSRGSTLSLVSSRCKKRLLDAIVVIEVLVLQIWLERALSATVISCIVTVLHYMYSSSTL